MATTKIPFEDATAGTQIISALIGNCNERFEIVSGQVQLETGTAKNYHLRVNGHEVPLEVFDRAFMLAQHDRFDPNKTEYAEAVIRRRVRQELLEETKASGVGALVASDDDDGEPGDGGPEGSAS